MLGLLWFLAAVGVLGTPFDLTAWTDLLTTIDGNLPLTFPVSLKLCYFFDISQSCSATAIGNLLSQAAPNLGDWTPTPAQCSTLLDGQRVYAEAVASSIFSVAIASAASALYTKFELLAQTWVLRVGHHALVNDYATFKLALNSISDWTTVQCMQGNLIFDQDSVPLPDFIGEPDCVALTTPDIPPPPDCAVAACSAMDGDSCCISELTSACCQTHIADITTFCSDTGCESPQFCCEVNTSYTCCANS